MTKLWVKLKPNNAAEVPTKDCTNVYQFIKEIKKKFAPDLDNIPPSRLSLSPTDGGPALRPGLQLTDIPSQPGYLENDDENPLFITVTENSVVAPTQDGLSPQFLVNTSIHSPLVGKVFSVSINESKLMKKYLTPVGSSPTTPVESFPIPIDISTLGLQLDQLMFYENTTARHCIIVDVQRDYDWTVIESAPPITIVLITEFGGQPLDEVMAGEEFKRVMPIRPTPSLPGTAAPISTTPEWMPHSKRKVPSYVLCIPIKVYAHNLRRLDDSVQLDAQSLHMLKLHILSLGGISANTDYEDLEEDDSDDDDDDDDDDVEVSFEDFNRIVGWDEIVL